MDYSVKNRWRAGADGGGGVGGVAVPLSGCCSSPHQWEEVERGVKPRLHTDSPASESEDVTAGEAEKSKTFSRSPPPCINVP